MKLKEDCICREDALKAFADYIAHGHAHSLEDFEEYTKILRTLPKVFPRPKKVGHWIDGEWGMGYIAYYICSKCGYRITGYDELYKYCPNCGTRMENAYMVKTLDEVLEEQNKEDIDEET